MIRQVLAAAAVVGVLAAATPASADNDDPLFVSLITSEGHRPDMAMVFSKAMMQRGHPVTIWLNDQGVLLAAKENAGKYGEQQKQLGELITAGATVIVCPMCMKHYGVKESDLIPGVQLGDLDRTGHLLFKDDTQTLTW